MEQRPTKKQRELLSFIDGFIKGNGYGPSYREIMRSLDYKSVSTVATHIDGLIARGWLVKRDNSARSLEVIAHGNDQPVAVSVGAVTPEQVILAKIEELKGVDNDAHATDIETLSRALVLLGYREVEKSTLG